MQIERVYYDSRWKMWKVEVALSGHNYIIPLSVAVEFANKLFQQVLMLLMDEAT